MSTLTPRQEETPTPHEGQILGEARVSGAQRGESGRTSRGGINVACCRVCWLWRGWDSSFFVFVFFFKF